MKPIARLTLALVVAGGSVVAWQVASRQAAPAPVAVALPTPPPPDANGLAVERDRAAVFQRAFWRRPAPDDTILHAERRDWLDASSAVKQWQWFVAVQPGAAFREWLLTANPFELVAIASGTALDPIPSPPAWFPPVADLATFTRYRNREGRFLVFHDAATNRLYATDSGGGFAVARQ